MWPRRAVLLGATAAVAGCSLDPIDLTPAPPSVTASEVVTDVEPDYVARAATGSEKNVPETDTLSLRVGTPHLNFVIEAVGFLDRLPAEAALELGEASALQPASGHQLAVVILRADQPATRLTAEEQVDVVLHAGTIDHAFADLFGDFHEASGAYDRPWEMLCCSVADGAPVTLRVRDADRTVTVDLRKRAAVEDEAWRATTGYREKVFAVCDPLSAITSTTFTSQPPANVEADSGTFRLALNPDVSAGLNPWLRGNGWSTKGQWLTMGLATQVEIPAEAPGIRLALDIGRTFTYISADGARHPGVSSLAVTLDDLRVGRVAPTIAFDIPDGDATGSIVIDPVGSAAYAYDDGTMAPATLTGSEPVTFTVAYSDALS